MRPGKLLLRTRGAPDLDPDHLLDVFGEQQQRFIAAVRGFGPADWAAPTRCADWSAHEVVRHMCDITEIATGTDDRTHDPFAGYDPRISPCRWLAASAGESPAATLDRLLAATEELRAVGRTRLAHNCVYTTDLPYGPVDWTVGVLHGFWDLWIHQRDVLLARGIEHPTSGDVTAYATAHGLFIAAAVASICGGRVHQELALGGDGGGVFDLDSRDAVILTLSRVEAAGPPAAEVADALAGRSPMAPVLGDLPARSRAALSQLGQFFNMPVEAISVLSSPRSRAGRLLLPIFLVGAEILASGRWV